MVKAIWFLKRRSDVRPADFHCYWRDIHGPLFCNSPAAQRYVLRYEHNHATPENAAMSDDEFDGASVMWFRSVEDLQALLVAPSSRTSWPTVRTSSTRRQRRGSYPMPRSHSTSRSRFRSGESETRNHNTPDSPCPLRSRRRRPVRPRGRRRGPLRRRDGRLGRPFGGHPLCQIDRSTPRPLERNTVDRGGTAPVAAATCARA